MKIHFSKKEYAKLIELVAIAENMVEDTLLDGSDELLSVTQKVYENAESMGCGDAVMASDELGGCAYIGSEDDDSKVFEVIGAYDAKNFIDELSHQLTERDLKKKYPPEVFADFDPEERILVYSEIYGKWFDEIEDHGISNLKVEKIEP